MFHQLVSHNEDIRRLVDKGYAVAFDSNNYLVVRDIPYLDDQRYLQWGAIVAKFVDAGQDRIVQDDHQIFFAGSVPHGLDAKAVPNLGGGAKTLALSEASKDVVVQRSFSNKPQPDGKYADFFEKIESYVNQISGPAIHLHGANPLTYRLVEGGESNSPFKFRDTLTSRAEIGDLAAKFKDDVVAVIGLGGTGAYVLDFLAKTRVKEIRGFDSDRYYVHNAFRSPGKVEDAEVGKLKTEVYQGRYDNFHTGLKITQKLIDASCVEDIEGVTFAFVCVDKGSSRAGIFDLLIARKIPFIDVGMGFNRDKGGLDGMVRTTYYSVEHGQKTRDENWAQLADRKDDIYRTNIQIGELNALNACLAVIKYKQLRGFYIQGVPYYHLLFELGNLKLHGHGEADQH
jgi:hypothetical protein